MTLFKEWIRIALVAVFCIAQGARAADALDNWTASNSGVTNYLGAVAFGQNKLVAVGAYGVIVTSPDGASWTRQNSGASVGLGGVAYGNSMYVAVGGLWTGTILTSPNAQTWTLQQVQAGPLLSVAYLNGQFFAVGGGGTNYAVILSSPDGVKWTVVLSSATHSNLPPQLDSIAYGNGIYVASHADQYGSGGATSVDGVNWRVNDGLGRAVCFGNGLFVGVSSFQTRDPVTRTLYSRAVIVTSATGLNSALQLDIPGYLDAISYGAGGFVAVGGPTPSEWSLGETTTVTSPDGTNWSKRVSSTGGAGLVFANGQFVSVGGYGRVFRSGVIGKLGASLSNGQFLGSISGITGQSFAIQASTDLASWGVLTNVPVTNGMAQFVDPVGVLASHRFYRAIVINQ